MFEELLNRDDVVIVDTETTGFGRSAEVIQVAALDTKGNTLLEALALPEEDIPASATRVHGWSLRKLEHNGAKPWAAVAPGLAACLENASIVLAWNAPFDKHLIAQTFVRHDLPVPRCEGRCCMQMHRSLHRGGKSTLENAAREAGVYFGVSHDALADCQTVLAIMRAAVNSGPGDQTRSSHSNAPSGIPGFRTRNSRE